jgi:hypothetical protein
VWQLRPCEAEDSTDGPPTGPACGSDDAVGAEIDSIAFSRGETEYVSQADFQERIVEQMEVEWGLCRVRDTPDGEYVTEMRELVAPGPDAATDWRFQVGQAGLLSIGAGVEGPGEWKACDVR